MTRVEKVIMAVIILLIISTVVFWQDVRTVFSGKKETLVENEVKKEKKEKKDSDDKDDKKKKNKDNESFLLKPDYSTLAFKA